MSPFYRGKNRGVFMLSLPCARWVLKRVTRQNGEYVVKHMKRIDQISIVGCFLHTLMKEAINPSYLSRKVGLAAPAKTPQPIIAYLNKQLNDVVQSQAFRSRMEALGMTVPAENTPQRLADYMRRETVRQRSLAALTGIKMTTPLR